MGSNNYKIATILEKLKSFFMIIIARIRSIFVSLSFLLKSSNKYKKSDLDKKLVYSFSKSKIPTIKQIRYIKLFLSPREVTAIKIASFIIFLNISFLGYLFYKNYLINVPALGGEYREAVIGSPKYINPLYSSINDVDGDISELVFSSLFKRDKDGRIITDLVENHSISKDGKEYTLKIRANVAWSNGGTLTADDIIFTFNAIKNSEYNSSLRNSFGGVEIEKIDDLAVRFKLGEPYAAFMELLTFGIIPRDPWEQIPPNAAGLAELNLKPISSGPYKFKSLIKDKHGNIRSYNLTFNEAYYGKKPLIKDIIISFYSSGEELVSALNENKIDGISYLPKYLKSNIIAQDSLNFYKVELPQLTAIFFNPATNVNLADKRVRQALSYAIPEEEIVKNILTEDYYYPIDSPIDKDCFAYNKDTKKYNYNKEEALKLFKEAGWELTKISSEEISKAEKEAQETKDQAVKVKADLLLALGAGEWLKKKDSSFNIQLTTVDVEDNYKAAEAIKEYWGKIGVKVDLNIVPVAQLQADIIKPREYEALLYGITLGADPDPYTYWHSSQIEKGLNISNFSNKQVDALLEDARISLNQEDRKTKYFKFQEIIAEEVPAIFLYSPYYNYVQSKKVKDFGVQKIFSPSDRFSDIENWYLKTKKEIVW